MASSAEWCAACLTLHGGLTWDRRGQLVQCNVCGGWRHAKEPPHDHEVTE